MRRIQFLLLAAFATTAFAACSDDKDPDPKPDPVDCSLVANKNHADCKDYCKDDANKDKEVCKSDELDCNDAANADAAECIQAAKDECTAAYEAPTGDDRCKNEADATAYALVKDAITGIAADEATKGCAATLVDPEDPAAMDELSACVACGVSVEAKLSASCSSCVADAVLCTVIQCLAECAADATATACLDCQDENGCLDDIDTCQGLSEADPV